MAEQSGGLCFRPHRNKNPKFGGSESPNVVLFSLDASQVIAKPPTNIQHTTYNIGAPNLSVERDRKG